MARLVKEMVPRWLRTVSDWGCYSRNSRKRWSAPKWIMQAVGKEGTRAE